MGAPQPLMRRQTTDGQGIPLAVALTGGIRHDVTQLPPLLDKIPDVTGQYSGGRAHAVPCSGSRYDDREARTFSTTCLARLSSIP